MIKERVIRNLRQWDDKTTCLTFGFLYEAQLYYRKPNKTLKRSEYIDSFDSECLFLVSSKL